MLISPLSVCSLICVDIYVEYQPHFIGITSHVAELVNKDLCKIIACRESFGLGYCLHEAMPSIIITLYFGEVPFIHVRPSLVMPGACALSDASISWCFRC